MRFFWKDDKSSASEKLRSGACLSLLTAIADYFTEAANDLNEALEDPSLRIKVDKPHKTKETLAAKMTDLTRVIVANEHSVLSIRGADEAFVEAFLLPAAQLNLVPVSEYPSRLKFKLVYQKAAKNWTLDDQIIGENDLRLLILAVTNDILKHSQAKLEIPKSLKIGRLSLTTGLRDLLFEKNQLISDLLAQEDTIHSRIAEELHDSVITDLLLLQRDLLKHPEIKDLDRMSGSLDEIVRNLRELCTEFSSRDIKDWGLKQALCNLVDRQANRSHMEMEFIADVDLPKLSYESSLQIYRMVQESLNNAIKHSKANRINVSLELVDSELTLTVQDDGIGFELSVLSSRIDNSGLGIPIMKERSDRLSAMGFPATVEFSSQPGAGVKMELRVDLAKAMPARNF